MIAIESRTGVDVADRSFAKKMMRALWTPSIFAVALALSLALRRKARASICQRQPRSGDPQNQAPTGTSTSSKVFSPSSLCLVT